MDNLYAELPNDELEALKAKYPDNASITSLIDGILEARGKEEEATKIRDTFSKKVAKLASLPDPPEGVYNVYLRWAEVEDDSVEPVEVKLPDEKTEMRLPKVWKWVVEINHADKVVTGKVKLGNGEATRGIGNKVWGRSENGMSLLLTDVSWRDAIKAINLDASKLAYAKADKLGKKEDGATFILETSASGKKDLESAGFITTTE